MWKLSALSLLHFRAAVRVQLQTEEVHETGQCQNAFPDGFKWAVATAAYQVEGAVEMDGRTPSIWDSYCRSHPGVACADRGDDMRHLFKDDIAMMARMHVTSYRFSISWSRLMMWVPELGRAVANPAGVKFYKDLIHELRRWNIEPLITLYHWDMPMFLEDNLGEGSAWLSKQVVGHFEDYARVAFTEFGHLVPMWFTMNEPWTYCFLGYGAGVHAPGRSGTATEAYLCAHNTLLAHAQAAQLYRSMRNEGTVMRRGKISIVINSDFGVPANPDEPADVEAAEAYMQYQFDWFLSPLVNGHYPPHMVERAGTHLPTFSQEESELVRGSLDGVLGLNHYTTHLITECDSPRSTTNCSSLSVGWGFDLHVDSGPHPSDARQSPECGWHAGYAPGYGLLLDYVHEHYPDLDILLTESGWCGTDLIDDQDQLWYYQTYLEQVHQAMQRGVPILGYTAWSLMDNYEWGSFQPRFGLWHVDYDTLERVPKTAALWFGEVAKKNCLDVPGYSTEQ